MGEGPTGQNEVPRGNRFPFLFIRPLRTALTRQLDLDSLPKEPVLVHNKEHSKR